MSRTNKQHCFPHSK